MAIVEDGDDLEFRLAGLSLLLDLPSTARHEVLSMLLEIGKREIVSEGETIFSEGDTAGDTGYVLLSGSVKVEKSYSESTICFAPALIGEAKQFVPGSARTATVRALDDLDVLRFDWNRFHGESERRLDEHDLNVLGKALLGYAWTHLLN